MGFPTASKTRVFCKIIEVVSNQLMFLKKGTKIRQTFSKVEKSFGGAIPLIGEIVTDRGQAALGDYQFANKVLDIERELEKVPGIKSVFSIFDLAIGINKMITGDNSYPQNPMIPQLLLMQLGQEVMKTWVSENGLRMMVKTKDLSSDRITEIEEFVVDHHLDGFGQGAFATLLMHLNFIQIVENSWFEAEYGKGGLVILVCANGFF